MAAINNDIFNKNFELLKERDASYKEVSEIPVSSRCAEILAQREHVLLGISACVGYYTIENIVSLLKWAMNNFKSYSVLLSGKKPLCANFEALGKKRSGYKASQYANNIFNKVKKSFALIDQGIDITKKIVIIENFLEDKKYLEVYNSVIEKYHNDILFKKNCREATEMVLKGNSSFVTELMIDTAVNYLLWELPFYVNSPKILSVSSSLIVYHKNIKFFTNLYKKREENFISNNQGHVIIDVS